MIHVGFTGTQQGMTFLQGLALANFLSQYGEFIGHHGDCVGADKQFDQIARAAKGFRGMEIHPMAFAGPKRAYCKAEASDIIHPAKPPLVRNETIASKDVLFATPKEDHMVLRSGTWTTVRYAVAAGRAVFIAMPSGVVIPWRQE